MYSQPIGPAPEKIVQDGKPVFGTFDSLPKKLDIKGIPSPFGGIPMPSFLSRLRIRARAIYVFSFGEYLGTIDFFDGKLLNMAEFSLWNTKCGTKHIYRNFLGARRKLVPTKLEKGQILSPSPVRHIRLSWNHPENRFSAAVNVRGFRHRPEINLSATGNFNDALANEIISVKPAPTKRRPSATWYASIPVKGTLEIKGNEKIKKTSSGAGLLFVNRSYYNFITHGENITAAGILGDRQITLRLSTTSLDAANTEKYNDNALFADGKCTKLPPVTITHPFGIAKDWIIQDYKSMVDLTFVPQTSSSRKADFIIVKGSYDTIFGFLNGTLLDAEGNKISVKDFPAVAKRSRIRL